jgi:predicted P-loop ATPase
MSALGDEALRLISLGWRVFPCRPGQKTPRTEKGFQDASIDAAQTRRWWPPTSRSNLAIATGPFSGLVVLDVDTAKGGMASLQELIAKHGPLPRTVAAKTPSGGAHYYFGWPMRGGVRNRANFLPGLDIRGEGGYVVAPPSTLFVAASGEVIGEYEWLTDPVLTPVADLPPWLEELIQHHAKQLNGGQHNIAPGPKPMGKATAYGEATLDAICEDIAHAPPGTQEVTLRDRTLRIGSLVAGGEIGEGYAKAALIHAGMQMRNGEAHNPWTESVVSDKVERHLQHGMRSPSKAPPRDATKPKLRVVNGGGGAAAAAAAEAPAQDPPPKRAAPARDAWMKGHKWLWTEKGHLRPKEAWNLQQMLEHHPALAGMFYYDVWADRLIMVRGLAGDPRQDYPREVSDSDGVALAGWLGPNGHGLSTTKGAVLDMLTMLAQQHWRVNPLTDWLTTLAWDGVERLDTWLIRYAGVDDSPYVRAVGRKFLISAVARALRPGCKVDTMLVLEGPQGIRKSSLLRALAGGPSGKDDDDAYFADQLGGDLTNKDAAQNLLGKWVIEVAEMERLSRAEASVAKEFLSRQEDRYRPSYGRMVVERKRVCVFAGSINPILGGGYLKDATGARRYWPVVCGMIDVAAMKADRAQVWAEAVDRFSMGELWWLEGEDEVAARAQQEERIEVHPWESALAKWMPDHTGMWTPGEILEHALEIIPARQTQAMKTDLAKTLTRMGIKKPGKDNRRTIGGRQVRCYQIGPPD